MSYNHVCSLGTQCWSSQIIKNNNLKKESYPFDWVFSNPDIIIDCLQNNFKEFLNKDNYNLDNKSNQNINKYYYSNGLTMFYHHNPYKNKDYEYFQRSVYRFNKLLENSNKKLFIMCLLDKKTYVEAQNERLVKNVFNLSSESAIKLNNELKKYTTNFTLVCFKQTIKGYCSWRLTKYDDTLDFIEITTIGKNDGGCFVNERDTKFCNFLLNKYYTFDIKPLDIDIAKQCSQKELEFINC